MRKTALTVIVSNFVLGIFAGFFRWLQNMNAYDSESGCAIPGHGTTIILSVYCVLALVVIVGASLVYLRRFAEKKDLSAIRCTTVFPTVLGWVLGIGFALAACVLLFLSDFGKYPSLQRIFGAAGILCGICFPFALMKKNGSVHSLGRTAASFVTLFACYWLVFSYRLNSAEPEIWRIAAEILALAASATAFYYVAAFHFRAGSTRKALIALPVSVFLNLITLFDQRGKSLSVMFLCVVAMQLMLEFLLVQNLEAITDSKE